MKRLAVIGSGISGHYATYKLKSHYDLTLYEADKRFGGHANTVDVVTQDKQTAVDTGFIVYNELTYPGLTQLFKDLKVETISTEMSFGATDLKRGFQYSTKSLDGLFAQRKNMFKPAYLKIWIDFMSFRKRVKKFFDENPEDVSTTLGTLLKDGKYSELFSKSFLYAVAGAIWSTAPSEMENYPASSFLNFMFNHKMLDPWGQPVWRTVKGGSRNYVNAIIASGGYRHLNNAKVLNLKRREEGVVVQAENCKDEIYDEVIVATHSNQALKMLENPLKEESEVLEKIHYQNNKAILHNDESLMPSEKRAWSAWNVTINSDEDKKVELTYDMNLLQSIKDQRLLVSLNNSREIDEKKIFKEIDYEHPFFDLDALKAQKRWSEISGKDKIHYCGAYWKWGFHEDGLWSANRVVEQLLQKELL